MTEKVDTYSFGVLLLVLVTGQESSGAGAGGPLAVWARNFTKLMVNNQKFSRVPWTWSSQIKHDTWRRLQLCSGWVWSAPLWIPSKGLPCGWRSNDFVMAVGIAHSVASSPAICHDARCLLWKDHVMHEWVSFV